MELKLSFLGAAQNVTGSSYLLEARGRRVLVDCGMYQERKFRERNWKPFPVPPDSLDAVLLTHAHLDHCGLLPKLCREGFRGTVHCTPATAEIARIVLEDSARLQDEDAEFKQSRHQSEGRESPHPYVPLYTVEDVTRAMAQFREVAYEAPLDLGEGLSVTFHDAGHILGSSMLRLRVGDGTDGRIIVFSGDVGRWDKPILNDPTPFEYADYVVCESTYGDRVHDDAGDIDGALEEVVRDTVKAGGNLVIPSFAVERTHELLYHLGGLMSADRIPHLMIFLDSPMAIHVTEVFRRHPELFDRAMTELVRENRSPFELPTLRETRSPMDSKAINHLRGTAVVIAGSGMCTGGRIKHHLVHNVGRPESTVLFIGYQADGTLGRQLLDGASEVRIFGQLHKVRCRVARIEGFSGHADRKELTRWLGSLRQPPRHVFVTHGEESAAKSFGEWLVKNQGLSASVPRYLEEAPLA